MNFFLLTTPAGSSSATLSYSSDWDLESGSLPTNTTVTLTCDDGSGLSDSATLDIIIEPVNEFPPEVDISSAELSINSSTRADEPLLSLNVSDKDYGDDGVFYFDVVGLGMGNEYFLMTDRGELKLKKYIYWNYNYTFSFTVDVKDENMSGNYLTSYVEVTVYYVATPQEYPEKISYCITCTTEGKLIVSALCLEACILIGIVCHIIVRCRAWELCTGRSSKIHDFG